MGRHDRTVTLVASSLLLLIATAGEAQPVLAPYPTAGLAAEGVSLLPPPPDALAMPPAPAVTQLLPYPSTSAEPTPVAPPTPITPLPITATEQSVINPDGIEPSLTEAIAGEAPVDGAPIGEELVVESVEEQAPVAWYRPRRWFGPTPWDTGFELGINGSSGTSDTLSLRTGGFLKRKTDATKFEASLYYNSTNAEGIQTQSNALLDARKDWLWANSRWSLFLMSQTFYDEFQAFDLNVNITGGIAYQLIDFDWMKSQFSFGSGASREFGGPQDEWVPEAQFGFDHEQSISDSQRFFAKVDYFPEWDDFSSFRVLSELGMEIDLSRPSNTSLKMSVSDRFDSSPDGVPAHNTNYSVLLLWKR